MKEGINLVMPMGGKGSRFTNEGFEIPKPLIKIKNITTIESIINIIL